MKKVFLLFIIYLIFVSSCEYFTLMSQKEWGEKSGKGDDVIVYVGGWYNQTIIKPCYWKIMDNDVVELVELENDNIANNEVLSIYVVGKNVYSCGYYNNGAVNKACYWINKKKYDLDLDPLAISSRANSIKVKSGVVFTAGTITIGANAFPYFWVNQSKSTINIKSANSIFIDQISSTKHSICVGGSNLKTDAQACFWKDGQITDLPPLPGFGNSSEVFSIYIIGNIVYSAGMTNIGVQQSCLWINKEQIILPGGEIANSIFVSNNDVYTSGVYNGGLDACYWKNTDYFQLTAPGIGGSALSIYVYNDNAYIAGGVGGFACYWINNKLYNFESNFTSSASSIFIVPNNEN